MIIIYKDLSLGNNQIESGFSSSQFTGCKDTGN